MFPQSDVVSALAYGSHMNFQALTFPGCRGSCSTVTQTCWAECSTSPRAPTSVNAMKQTCMTVILAYLPNFNQISTENTAKPFLTYKLA